MALKGGMEDGETTHRSNFVWICGVGVIVAGILYFVSFDSFMKDVERRLDEVKKKRR